ncbi:GLPGLI family protein [Zunongwangia endophytica]|uniref:GLPGLI family protein n=1 Tax=Zunongwangia endophytica TaxID=1808945 RepID=A0ABV8H810_9FLAO|nr:GLPGLI family protein [Zunongwangia endophytica]MDN3595417.1 GLPGLI family protein [Zunongwangia endophytica]
MRSLFILVFILCLENVVAQNSYSYKATYQLEYQEDSTDENSIKTEKGVLYLGKDHSRYSSLGKAVKDSLENMPNPKGMTMGEYNQMTDFDYTIYKDYQDNEITLAEKVFQYEFKYQQDLKQIDWEIQPENKEILGFSVQKATGAFAGRKYIAWFAPELPFSDGPYKFSGLPGLIVGISDFRDDYHFTLTGFQELEKPVNKLLNLDSYKAVSQKELDRVRDDYNRDPIGTMEKAGIRFGWSEEDEAKQKKELTKKYKRRNNPIELQK